MTVRRSVESRRIELAGDELEYRLQRSSARRTLALVVREAQLVVQAPWQLPLNRIEAAVESRADWIRARLAASPVLPAPDWRDGMLLYWMGRETVLALDARVRGVGFDGQVLRVAATEPARVRNRVLAWYRTQAAECFAGRMQRFLPALRRQPQALQLTSARTRWGSCTRDGVIRINWRLVQASEAEIDYVLAHELAHLAHLDHSERFWDELARLEPEFELGRRRLREAERRYQQISR